VLFSYMWDTGHIHRQTVHNIQLGYQLRFSFLVREGVQNSSERIVVLLPWCSSVCLVCDGRALWSRGAR